MSALREILASFDIQISGADKAKAADKGIEGLTEKLSKFGTFLAGGIVLNGVKDLIGGLEDQAVALRRTSQELGINQQDLQAWQTAARLSGVDVETFTGALKKLEIAAGKASEGGLATGGEFQKLGVHLREDAGGPMRNMQEILHDTGIAIAKLPDPMARAEAVTKTFGRAGQALIPLFNKGEDGLKEYLSQIDKLGGGLSDNAIDNLEKMKVAGKKWDITLTSVKSQLVVSFLPALTNLIDRLAKGALAISKNEGAMNAIKIGAIAVGATFAAAGLAASASWLPIVVLFAGLALIIQDVIVGMNGGDSVTGRLLDKVFGKGTHQNVFAILKESVRDYADEVNKAHASNSRFTEGFLVFNAVPMIVFNALSHVGDQIHLAGQTITDNLKAMGMKIPGDLTQVLTDGLTGSAKQIIDDFKQLGSDIVDGVIQGIKDKAGEAEDALKSFGKRLIGGAKAGADSHSPSVPMIKLGKDLGLGAIIGAESMIPHVEATMARMGQAAVRAPAQAIQQTAPVSRSAVMHAQIQNNYTIPGGSRETVAGGVRQGNDESMRAALNSLRSYVA